MNDQFGLIFMGIAVVLLIGGFLFVLWRRPRGRQQALRETARRDPAAGSPSTSPRGAFPEERQQPVDPRERRDGPGPGA